ncbi:hypothetical protein BBBOND_0306160 [Babesia bigemina]|uniref:Uncharacterized protein n=1 Tax=Babesia bigemina TaxID=5866 RepID=A0A061D9R0_BABBI|nr:hypothetical protein BBBOND_0306160 [Babesia bigemina]CDR96712.1 hypothetical protein BBBOND_0306160 [Babesia bigemina]|eukprot:XP_012768898.1 hypothetical protein BBBOND_0306160 [Babesia bigemina]
MVYTSLTEAPHNLKEGIDWLMALKGTDGVKNVKAMSEALYNFLADKPVGKMELPALEEVKLISKDFLGLPQLKGPSSVGEILGLPQIKGPSPVGDLQKRYETPMDKTSCMWLKRMWTLNESDYDNIVEAWGLTTEDFIYKLGRVMHATEKFLEGVKISDQYESAYSTEATWEASCSEKPEDCAVVLVGMAPMLYAGLLSLKDASQRAAKKGPQSKEETRLREVLEAVGYVETQRNDNLSGSDVLMALSDVDKQLLYILYDFAGYWAFY